MRTSRKRRTLPVATALSALLAISLAAPSLAHGQPDGLLPSGIDADEFAAPSMEYRPGVRWWWPGNGATEEDLLAQVEYLHDNGFGAVEIVAFSKGFLTGDGTTTGYIYDGLDLGYDVEQILGYESPEYFDKLQAVVARANELGITVDLNIGSGYLANDDSIDITQSQSNMALGRATVAFDPDTGLTLTGGDIAIPESTGIVDLGIPAVEVSPFYASELFGFDFGVWSAENVDLSAVIVAPVLDEGEPLATNNQVLTQDFAAVKTYDSQTVVDLDNAILTYPESSEDTFTLDTGELTEGSYEVIALYRVPAGSYGLNSIIENTTTGERNLVVDHLNPDAVSSLVDGWLGHPRLNSIVDEHDVRAAFNDSYEFYTDAHYNDIVQLAATSQDLLGYDITRFFPAFYAFFSESFLIDGAPTIKDEYSQLGMNSLVLDRFSGGNQLLLDSGLSDDELDRVEYDYGRLLNEAFQLGMAAFSDTLGDYGIAYRQQAYNPPVDTLKSSAFVDIPETEGLDEYNLKRVASGAHLYGKNLVTSEVYTLGSVPFTVTPDFIKQGYDLMATSGVNNFFYHGLSATYFGNPDPAYTADDNLFPEEGWRAWPTIGVEMAETAAISGYYGSMNAYASRANYAMQAGTPSVDVAVYMPLFGALSTAGRGFSDASIPLDSIDALQRNGYQWSAINDDTIQGGLTWQNGKLIANGGTVSFNALVVESDTVPVETMQALSALQSAGAPIYFLDSAPARQPSYADGAYAELDEQVAQIAAAMDGVTSESGLLSRLAQLDAPPITYDTNDSVRFNRRTLYTGGELAYFRNTSQEAGTSIDIEVASNLSNCYWLDPATGNIHTADVAGDSTTATLDPAGAVILLCEPEGTGFGAEVLSGGLPVALVVDDFGHGQELTSFTLEVAADNIGTNEPGDLRTERYDGDVLGDWSSPEVFEGALSHVTDPGSYRTSFTVSNAAQLNQEAVLLSLGAVHDAATVTVNPGTDSELVAQLYHVPFELDISGALIDGENELVIDVQPVKNNRRVGLAELYASDSTGHEAYQSYASLHGRDTLMPAGLIGPVTLRSESSIAGDPGGTPSKQPTEPSPGLPSTGSVPPAHAALFAVAAVAVVGGALLRLKRVGA